MNVLAKRLVESLRLFVDGFAVELSLLDEWFYSDQALSWQVRRGLFRVC